MAMALHETYKICDYVNKYREIHEWVVRIPGGWIYYRTEILPRTESPMITSSSVFVPEPKNDVKE